MSDDNLYEEAPQTKFRPSYSATTLRCPGSLLPSLKSPDTAGYPAAEGTVFHSLIAKWQLDGARPNWQIGEEFKVDRWIVPVDRDMYLYAEECLEHYADIPGQRFVEVRLDISHLTPIPNQSGTGDLLIASPGILHVIDWKYGKGWQVFARRNTQLLCYGSGAYRALDWLYDFKRIILHIAQPRLEHYDIWEITPEELFAFEAWARMQWASGWRGELSRFPSPAACQWCRVRLRCAARQAMMERIVDETCEVIEDVEVTDGEQRWLIEPELTLKPPVELTTERLAQIYRFRRSFEVWFKEIGEELIRRAREGHDLGGIWKLVEGRLGNRSWRDEETAAAALRRLGVRDSDLWDRSLVSPAQAERLLAALGIKGDVRKRYLGLYTDRAQGQTTLAPIEDGRQDMAETIESTLQSEL